MVEGDKRLKVGVARETYPGEGRVAIIPDAVPLLMKRGLEVMIESGAGLKAGFTDDAYKQKGAEIVADRAGIFSTADIILCVRCAGANTLEGKSDFSLMRKDQVIIGMMDPLSEPKAISELADTGAISFALELIPRITRAQSMDVLSSMANIAGYKAVVLAADMLPKMFPMMMTAAGTITPARVFVVGVGVAGLQAIATAKRLGAVVKAYDIRPAVKEQVQSLGADFVELELGTVDAEDSGGYAKAMDEEFYKRQREMMKKVVAESDVVITTASVPGKKAPILITTEMALGMAPGSVIVDLAAERGGNCECTKFGETIKFSGLTIVGLSDLSSTVPYHASQMYAKNISTFLLNLIKDGELNIDLDDEIISDTLLTRDNEVINSRVSSLLGLSREEENTDKGN